jgi:hypothetical protein
MSLLAAGASLDLGASLEDEVTRRGADEELPHARPQRPCLLRARPERQLVRIDVQGHVLCLAWIEHHPVELHQLPDSLLDAGRHGR